MFQVLDGDVLRRLCNNSIAHHEEWINLRKNLGQAEMSVFSSQKSADNFCWVNFKLSIFPTSVISSLGLQKNIYCSLWLILCITESFQSRINAQAN